MKLFFTTAALLGAAFAQNPSALPTVDLGYEIYQAASFNVGLDPLVVDDMMLIYSEHWWFL